MGLENIATCFVGVVILISSSIFIPVCWWLAVKVLRNITPPQIHKSTKENSYTHTERERELQ